jgi:hypothetical protein
MVDFPKEIANIPEVRSFPSFILNQFRWKEDWEFCAKAKMTSNLVVRGEYESPSIIIEYHNIFC